MIQLGRSTPHVFLFQSIVKSRSTVYLTGFPIHTKNLAGSPAWNSSPRQPEGSAVRLAVLDVGTPRLLIRSRSTVVCPIPDWGTVTGPCLKMAMSRSLSASFGTTKRDHTRVFTYARMSGCRSAAVIGGVCCQPRDGLSASRRLRPALPAHLDRPICLVDESNLHQVSFLFSAACLARSRRCRWARWPAMSSSFEETCDVTHGRGLPSAPWSVEPPHGDRPGTTTTTRHGCSYWPGTHRQASTPRSGGRP